jgi:hypothetical protein
MVRRPNWGQSDWEPPKQRRRSTDDVKTLRGAEARLLSIFAEIVHHHGLEKTREMFENYVRLPTALDLEDYGKMKLLERLDNMKPRPNIKQLVRELIEENNALPSPDRHLIPDNLDKQIRRLKRDRERVTARFGNVSPPLARDEPARFFIIETKNGTFRKRQLS